MSRSFHLTVLTPERALLEIAGVTQVQAQLADGGPIGIYPGHAPLLAETVAAPLHYANASGEHALDLDAGILQVSKEGVTVFASSRILEVSDGPQVRTASEVSDDRHFDQLERELLTTLDAQPEGVLGGEEE
jgi:F-type H+-transporting ATPase subunit epsilon